MPTETYAEFTNHTQKPTASVPGYGSTDYWGFRNEGSRTFIRRPKPLTEFLAPLPYDLSVRNWRMPQYEASIRGHRYITAWQGHREISAYFQTAATAMMPQFSSNLYNGVITDLRLKVKDQTVNLGQAWAERAMTANLLADSITRIAKSYQYLRKGNWRAAKRQLTRKRNERALAALKRKYPLSWDRHLQQPASAWKQAPASWLEFQYGWNPLIADVLGSIELLKTYDDPVDWRMTVKAGRKQKNKVSASHTTATFNVQLASEYQGDTFRGVFARADYAPSFPFLQRLGANTSITNPALLAWELMPFSFVIDWGVQIGDWISSMDATLYMQFLAGCYTDRRELVLRARPVNARYGSTETIWTKPAWAEHRRFELHRGVWDKWPIATAPRFKDPLSVTHVANAMSLLAEALKHGPLRVR